MKTYAELCLERCEKATEGPWHTAHINEDDSRSADIEGPHNECVADDVWDHDRNFIINARFDVPELARRLDAAILRLKEAAHLIHACGQIDDEEYEDELNYIRSLEALPEDGK